MKSNAFVSSSTRTKLVVNCGLLIAISIVLKILFEVYIPLGGFPSLRLNITALPIMLSGILLGPFAGFVVGFISDLLCFFIKPGGPFFIGFTLSSGLTGLVPGLLFLLLRKKEIKHLEWFNLGFILLSILVLYFSGVFSFNNGSLLYANEEINSFVLFLFMVLVLAFVLFPIYIVKKSNLNTNYRSDHILFIVSVTQLIVSIILNTCFLAILYGQAVSVILPARIISNIFLIPLYTIMLVGLLKVLPRFTKL
ncbi:MAG: folate family ECF transporter S component [Eubacteriaceae bacterium]